MASGEQAARIAIDCLVEHVSATAAPGGPPLRTAILDAVDAANRTILELQNGAGATLAVVQLDHGEARPYHVGDSQILLVGNRGKVKMLTTSPFARGLRRRVGHARGARCDGPRGAAPRVELPRVRRHARRGGQRAARSPRRDGLLVASDGVLDNLLLDEIVDLLRTGTAADAAAADRRAGLAADAGRCKTASPTSPTT